ncbi:MAG: homoserine kinase [Acidobacteriota bacterium]|nr:homoserine kinase [Acidobacteriota bacterium]
MSAGALKLVLPATSANLGPGFDAVGLAMSLYLTVEAETAAEFSIAVTGRDAALCGAIERNLIVETYREILLAAGKPVTPLALKLHNEIPLGMGCGSSAAALLAGVALADQFGDLQLGDAGIVTEASRREGHPDNVAACWHGGFTVSAMTEAGVQVATFAGNPDWRLLLAMQPVSLATKDARALLPESYSKADAVFNVQRAVLLVAAFAQGRLDLLAAAMQDRLHQPYRQEACPLLKALLSLNGERGIAGVALSGAGPSVLLVLNDDADEEDAIRRARKFAGDGVELLSLRIAGAAVRKVE